MGTVAKTIPMEKKDMSLRPVALQICAPVLGLLKKLKSSIFITISFIKRSYPRKIVGVYYGEPFSNLTSWTTNFMILEDWERGTI